MKDVLKFNPKYLPCAKPMLSAFFSKILLALFLVAIFILPSRGQAVSSIPYTSQEVSDIDGIPVLIKHLPAWESVRSQTTFAKSGAELKAALGERPIIDLIDFSGGTEAVTAPYDAGKLLIIEYTTPQASVDADAKFTASVAESGDGSTIYRRIGNYNAFVFDAPDRPAAEALLDQVKYEKQVHWLGDNPFLITAERVFVLTTSDIFLSTALVIVFGMGGAVLIGIIVGFIFFNFRDGKRSKLRTFSDAGGMTRLNLDGFTPNISSESPRIKKARQF